MALKLPRILSQRLWFPDPRRADAEGLVAVGGDLSVERLLLAYRSGIFPWTADPISWWSPDPRGVFELTEFRRPRSLARFMRSKPFAVTVNQAFEAVMRGCAEPGPGRWSTWISDEFLTAYCAMHKAGHAHSVETWCGERLVGGIYGVAVGGLFAGESMFHRESNASKVAVCHLVERLVSRGFKLFDIQMITPATAQLGAVEIPRSTYLSRLAEAASLHCTFM